MVTEGNLAELLANEVGAIPEKTFEKNKSINQLAFVLEIEPLPSAQSNIPNELLTYLSPLRYPGSKRKFASYVEQALTENSFKPKLYVEPFAGGASVALHLLSKGLVENVVLADLDPLVAAFWSTVFSDDYEWLIEKIQTISVTIDQWEKYKAESVNIKDRKERALACLFLNRTSFSGIIRPEVGPIGGHKQNSKYKIDCRFNRDDLSKRIKYLAQFRGQVKKVENISWDKCIKQIREEYQNTINNQEIFFYFDPPFYDKARDLYNLFFDDNDHISLRNGILNLDNKWLLSYDAHETIRELYANANHGTKLIDLIYSVADKGLRKVAKELVVSNLEKLPVDNYFELLKAEKKEAGKIKRKNRKKKAQLKYNQTQLF